MVLAAPVSAQTIESIEHVRSARGVDQPFVLVRSTSSDPKRVLILFEGGDGLLGESESNGVVEIRSRSFTARIRTLLAQAGLTVILPLPPSDRRAIDFEFRDTDAHLRDLEAIVRAVEANGAQIHLAGVSNGAVSVSSNAYYFGRRIAGLILLAASTDGVVDRLRRPFKVATLVIHHEQDRCLPFEDTEQLARGYRVIRVRASRANAPDSSDRCGPESAHQFAGAEDAIAMAISRWITSRKAPAEIVVH